MKITKLIRTNWDRRKALHRHGQATVEFALVVPLFFLLMFGIIDIGRAVYVENTLQYAMRQAGRFAVTGNHLTDSSGNTMSRTNSIIQVAENAAVGLDISHIQISSKLLNSTNAATVGSAGGPQQMVTISLTTNLQLVTPMIGRFFGPNGIYTFTVQTTFLNEPFPPSETN